MSYKSRFKNVFTYAAGCEVWFKGAMAESGYEPTTTYYSDFSIAEWCDGTKGVRDTYERAIREHKGDYKVLTEICVVINYKSWQFAGESTHDDELREFYSDLYYECCDTLTGREDEDGTMVAGLLDKEGLAYFYRVTD